MENPTNLNIFGGAPASFRNALSLFSGVTGAVLPVRQEAAGAAQLYAISPVQEGGQLALPAFTGEELLNPPLIRKSLADTAALFFHAPAHEFFIFNPVHPQSRLPAAPLKASRREISLLAGFIKLAGKDLQGDLTTLAAGEFALGNLHAAHYLYDQSAARNPASRARFRVGTVLVELGLLQEAYDSLKNDTDPEALLCLAVIHRKTGNTAQARKTLSALGQGTQLEERRVMETAWLALEEGKEEEAEKIFQRLISSAFDKVEALSGLGAAMTKTAFRTRDRSRLATAAAALRSALSTPSPASVHVFSQLGNLYFRSGDAAQAEACYRRSAALAPAVQALANLALTLIKTGKQEEAAAVTAQIALTDLASARRVVASFPQDRLPALFQPLAQAGQAQAPNAEANLLSPAQPMPSISDRTPAVAPAAAPRVEIETIRDTMSRNSQPSEEESRKDNFISRAFKLASALEDELGRKVYFNLDGLSEVEKKLRVRFLKAGANQQGNLEAVRDCAAFLCYFLQERHKGRLIKMEDFDPWGWPMIFEQPGQKVTTYPIQRIWRLLWEEAVPEPGWLTKYSYWLAAKFKEPSPPPCGAAAARSKTASDPERVVDAQTEHKRMLVLISSLSETSHIELGRSGLQKLEAALKAKFMPDIPPTADGWKLLRCYGHVFAAILAKDFKATWYNTDGDDGGWSMQLPWKTFVFPLGKVYKTASLQDDLDAYYEVLLQEKLRYRSEPM